MEETGFGRYLRHYYFSVSGTDYLSVYGTQNQKLDDCGYRH